MAAILPLAAIALGIASIGYGWHEQKKAEGTPPASPPSPLPLPGTSPAPAPSFSKFTSEMLPSGTPYLRNGSRGTEVQKWQSFLLFKGYPLNGGADGIFGPSTEQHTRAFQTKAGISADGIVGPQTITAARASL